MYQTQNDLNSNAKRVAIEILNARLADAIENAYAELRSAAIGSS